MAHDLTELMVATAALHESTDNRHSHLRPWGWDSAVAERFKKMGYPTPQLPSDDSLNALRQCSERGVAHRFLRTFIQGHPSSIYIGESLIIRTIEAIAPYAERHGHILLKAPLSSSGKGLRHINNNDNDSVDDNCHSDGYGAKPKSTPTLSSTLKKVESWANALILRHGYLTAEPYYDKVQDFAMEFMVDATGCRFIGYSFFATDGHGRYTESLLMSDTDIEELLCAYVPREALHEIIYWTTTHHAEIIPSEWDVAQFPLFFGIDMMIVTENSRFKVHPCVEINMRMNMGIIAHELYRHYMAPTAEGTFRIARFPNNEALRRFHSEQTELYPAMFNGDRLVEGYSKLTPITHDTLHIAFIHAKRNRSTD